MSNFIVYDQDNGLKRMIEQIQQDNRIFLHKSRENTELF